MKDKFVPHERFLAQGMKRFDRMSSRQRKLFQADRSESAEVIDLEERREMQTVFEIADGKPPSDGGAA